MNRNFRPGIKVPSADSLLNLRSRSYDGKIAGLYDLEETLGRGHFAVVKLARHVFTGEKVAVKVIDKSKLDEVSKAHLFQEVRCMKLVQHPNVVRLYEVIDTATKLYLVLELGDGGDLYEYILKHDAGLPETAAHEYFSQIVRAITYCHQLHVVHRDLKPENVVFFKKLGIVKLTDFGFSNKFYPGQKLETSCGSLAYSAPEILLGDSYDAPAVDVWSLGVILYMLVCGQPPFQEANDSETLTMIMDCKYEVPPHVSDSCRKLISRMLVRNPEKRATLAEIAKHPWLCGNNQEAPDMLPLVSKEHLLEEDHNLIIQKIVNGNIATKEEIQQSLEKNEYNHITATYYLLAERKLRAKRQEISNKTKRPEQLTVKKNAESPKDNLLVVKPTHLNVPRTPGDLPQRSRKCSIVQEDEEEEDVHCSRIREDLGAPLNRRGSRSEGRLSVTLQERLVELERRKPIEKPKVNDSVEAERSDCKQNKNDTIIHIKTTEVDGLSEKRSEADEENASTIFETVRDSNRNRKFVSRGPPYEQRRSKFKTRTTSCSSSDASDDDSEKRKKQAQKLTASAKPFQGRRDSHDDSSDSQEPGTGAGSSGGRANPISDNSLRCNGKTSETNQKNGKYGKTANNSDGGGKKTSANGLTNVSTMFRKQKSGRKKSHGKTRLRQSRSLNRITEVQEDASQASQVVISTTIFSIQSAFSPKVKSLGSRILQSFNKNGKKINESDGDKLRTEKDKDKDLLSLENGCEIRGVKKSRMLMGKYFHVHKKICIPLPAFLSRNRLYRAQSCGSLVKSEESSRFESIVCENHRLRAVGNGDINQNRSDAKARRSSPAVLDLNDVCTELSGICQAVNLGRTARCCSFC